MRLIMVIETYILKATPRCYSLLRILALNYATPKVEVIFRRYYIYCRRRWFSLQRSCRRLRHYWLLYASRWCRRELLFIRWMRRLIDMTLFITLMPDAGHYHYRDDIADIFSQHYRMNSFSRRYAAAITEPFVVRVRAAASRRAAGFAAASQSRRHAWGFAATPPPAFTLFAEIFKGYASAFRHACLLLRLVGSHASHGFSLPTKNSEAIFLLKATE